MHLITFPQGIATYSGACDLYAWTRPQNENRLLFNDYDLFMIREGRMLFAWPDGSQFESGPQSFALIPPRVPIRVKRLTACPKYWYCHFTFRALPPRIHPRLAEDYLGPGSGVAVPFLFTRKQAPQLWQAYQDLVAPRLRQAPWKFEAGLLRMVGELKLFGWAKQFNAGGSGAAGRHSDPRLDKVIAKVHADPQRTWHVSELAESVGISADRLNSISRRITQKTMKNLIIDARFQLAFRLLHEPSGVRRSIKEVSARCGFSSQHYFCRQFKKYFNQTPSDFVNNSIST
jgi:AraC-like DNA-binding protein